MSEINLLKNYPKTKRNLKEASIERTDEVRKVARLFGKDFFDGERKFGYGGYSYNPKYWSEVVIDFKNYYSLKDDSKILDIGCGKGFMLYDFKKLNKNFIVKGIDISKYAIENSLEEIKSHLQVASCEKLPFDDNSFDLAISINTIHNLDKAGCALSLKEMSRVSKNNFLIVDAYKTEEEKIKMFQWNLTAKTILHVDEWKLLFKENNYNGDYYWFNP